MSKVKPILYMFGKGGISVLQTAIFINVFASDLLLQQYYSKHRVELALKGPKKGFL